MSNLRERFVARFGLDLAETIERGIEDHAKKYPMVLDRGSDPFRFVLVWAVGFECLVDPAFRREHGITVPWADLAAWIRAEADLASYDGTMDLAGRGFGSFDAILGPHTESDEAAGLDAAHDWLLATMPVGGRA